MAKMTDSVLFIAVSNGCFIRKYLRKNGTTVSFVFPLMIDLVLRCLIMNLLFY